MERSQIKYAKAIDLVCNQPKGYIDQLAEKAAEEMLRPGGDIIELTRRLGGRIEYKNMYEGNVDVDTIFVHGKNDFDITLPEHSTPRRDRFTIAHELGHYFLHSWMGQRPLKAARNGSDRAEWEANWFAAGFIMPNTKFRSAHAKCAVLNWLANEFDVSEHAAKVRCEVLDLKLTA